MQILLPHVALVLLVCGFANSDLPINYNSFNAFGKFRPSQNLDSSSGSYEYSQYTPNDFILNLKTPSRVYGVPPIGHLHPNGNPLGPLNPGINEIPEYPHQRPPQSFYNAPPNGYYNQPHTRFQVDDLRPPQLQKPLFTPAGSFRNYPATEGQINNYNQALDEELKQQQQEASAGVTDEPSNTAFANGFTGYSNLGGAQPAKSYVNVKLGPQNLQYQYQF